MSPALLVVAGHDSSGERDGSGRSAGLLADREAAGAFECTTLEAVTAWTDQAAGRVRSVGAREPCLWLAEARALLAQADAVKAGLLPGAAHAAAFGTLVDARERHVPVVVDPVLAASGGELFVPPDELARWRDELLVRPLVLTPNLPELAGLLEVAPRALDEDLSERLEAARALLARGLAAVVVKGGHGREDPVQDLVWERGAEPSWHAHPRRRGAARHGSGCLFATALAAGLAHGAPLPKAAAAAGEFVAARLVPEA